jgi:hypothetical protein
MIPLRADVAPVDEYRTAEARIASAVSFCATRISLWSRAARSARDERKFLRRSDSLAGARPAGAWRFYRRRRRDFNPLKPPARRRFDSGRVHLRRVLFTNATVGAVLGAAMLALSIAPASAFTLSAPSFGPSFSAGQIDKVWWHRHCWRGRWRWHCRRW